MLCNTDLTSISLLMFRLDSIYTNLRQSYNLVLYSTLILTTHKCQAICAPK